METKYLEHKSGGRITKVHAIGHGTDANGAYWFFIADVQWYDGTSGTRRQIAPGAMCYDHDIPEAHDEFNRLYAMLNRYLLELGTFSEKASRWVPVKRRGEVPLSDFEKEA